MSWTQQFAAGAEKFLKNNGKMYQQSEASKCFSFLFFHGEEQRSVSPCRIYRKAQRAPGCKAKARPGALWAAPPSEGELRLPLCDVEGKSSKRPPSPQQFSP